MTGVLMRAEKLDTESRQGRDQRDVSTSQGHQGLWHLQDLGEPGQDLPSEPQQEPAP